MQNEIDYLKRFFTAKDNKETTFIEAKECLSRIELALKSKSRDDLVERGD